MSPFKAFIDRISRCFKAALMEWRGEESDIESFRITALTGSIRKDLTANGMSLPYYGSKLPEIGKPTVFKLRKHCIDKYGRVRYFDEVPDDYIDIMERCERQGSYWLKDYVNKKPQWTYAGFLAEEDNSDSP